MRYGIFSDIHANLEALEKTVLDFKKEKVDRVLCIGDIIGYGANPRESIAIVQDAAMITVAGNHDWATLGLFSMDYFNLFARDAVLWTRQMLNRRQTGFLESLELTFSNQDLTLVHGTLDTPEEFNYMFDESSAEASLQLLNTDICFVGHTHVPAVFVKDKKGKLSYSCPDSIDILSGNKYIINVGSVGQPRDHDPRASYCIYDVQAKRARIKRLDYDVQAARKKIIRAGLPKFLGDRLLKGI